MQTSHGSSASRSSSGISQIGVLSRRSTLATQRRMAGWPDGWRLDASESNKSKAKEWRHWVKLPQAMHARHIILWEPGKLYESRAFISRLIYILYYTEKSVIETNCKNNWPSQPSYIFPIQLIFPKTLWIQTTFKWHQHHEGVSKNISTLSFAKKHLRVHVHISAVCVWVWWCPHAEGHRRRRHGLQHILSKNFQGSLKTPLRPGCRIYSYDVQCATLPSLCRKGTLLGTWRVKKNQMQNLLLETLGSLETYKSCLQYTSSACHPQPSSPWARPTLVFPVATARPRTYATNFSQCCGGK